MLVRIEMFANILDPASREKGVRGGVLFMGVNSFRSHPF